MKHHAINPSELAPIPADLDITPGQSTIVSVLRKRASLHPEKKAFIFLPEGGDEEIPYSYGDLDLSARKVAARITALGFRGKKLLLFYPAGLEFVTAFFGCLYAGAIPVPAYPPRKNRSLQRIHSIVENCGAVSILTTAAIAKMLQRNFSEDPLLKDLAWHVTEEWIADETPEAVTTGPAFEDLAFLQYTSGSTGTPKGVMVSHRNIMYNLRALQVIFQIVPDDIAVHWVPQFHDLGLIFGVLETIFSGSTSILIPPVIFVSDPLTMLKAITKYKATVSGQPDFAFHLCVEKIPAEAVKDLDLSSIRIMYSGAEPVRKPTMDSFFALFGPAGLKTETFYPAYGMAESTLILTGAKTNVAPVVYLPVKASSLEQGIVSPAPSTETADIQWIASNGEPRIDTEVIIADPETRQETPDGRVGEIWARGNTVTMGYHGLDDLTGEVFGATLSGQSEPAWLRTGDLGFIHNGELFITGRLKDLIIIHGRNFYPQDIELSAEESHSSIRKNCVAAFSIEFKGEERLAIVAELHRSILPQDKDKIIESILAAISRDFEIQPARITLIRTGSLLKTSSGKIMRRATRESILAGKLDVLAEKIFEDKEMVGAELENFEKPDLEKFILKWISYHLNNGQPVDPEKGLADYGMDSLRAVLLTDDTKNIFGFEWPPYLFFSELSIHELCREGMGLMEE